MRGREGTVGELRVTVRIPSASLDTYVGRGGLASSANAQS
jgi:hypothetical protein